MVEVETEGQGSSLDHIDLQQKAAPLPLDLSFRPFPAACFQEMFNQLFYMWPSLLTSDPFSKANSKSPNRWQFFMTLNERTTEDTVHCSIN